MTWDTVKFLIAAILVLILFNALTDTHGTHPGTGDAPVYEEQIPMGS